VFVAQGGFAPSVLHRFTGLLAVLYLGHTGRLVFRSACTGSFSTDLQETDVIFGAEEKLYKALVELIDRHQPKAAFVYSTCIVGIIGDDLEAVSKRVEREKGIPVIPVQSEGFKGNKRAGYNAACKAMFRLIGTGDISNVSELSVNILGDFNLAGEIWIIREYFERMGLEVVANITGDGRVDDIRRAHGAALNVVQCSGSTMDLAKMMEEEYGMAFMRVSYFGVEDMAESLYNVARFFADKDPEIMVRTADLVKSELTDLSAPEARCASARKRHLLEALRFFFGKAFRLGDGCGAGRFPDRHKEDYRELRDHRRRTIIVDDSNPLELASFLQEKDVDIFVGGVKERPIAYKLGVGFCDHNHERKEALEGFVGMLNFAKEVYSTVMSPVWRFVPRKGEGRSFRAPARLRSVSNR
jgi:nitrogenase molybdenum-cofactor synthesis protein NifE